MARVLATHLLVARDRKTFRTACGIDGIPLDAKYSFSDSDDRLEGRIPGSAGNGVVAMTSGEFGFPQKGRRFCGRCMKKFAKGEGIF